MEKNRLMDFSKKAITMRKTVRQVKSFEILLNYLISISYKR